MTICVVFVWHQNRPVSSLWTLCSSGHKNLLICQLSQRPQPLSKTNKHTNMSHTVMRSNGVTYLVMPSEVEMQDVTDVSGALVSPCSTDYLHSIPVGQMGNYQEYLKMMPSPLREIDPTPPQHPCTMSNEIKLNLGPW